MVLRLNKVLLVDPVETLREQSRALVEVRRAPCGQA